MIICRLSVVAFMVSVCISLGVPAAEATPYIVTDSNFVSDVYNFSYRTSTNMADNGGTPVAGDPWLTNTGFTRAARAGSWHWRLPGSDFQRYYGSGVSGTVGFDFSSLSSSIGSVVINPANFLFNFVSGTAFDIIRGEVATPGTFGSGGFTEIYSFVGCDDCTDTPFAMGTGILDLTPFLSAGWLASPGLLEFRFSYTQSTPSNSSEAAIAENIQVFRDQGPTNTGFQLQATAAAPEPIPEPATMLLLGTGLVGVAGAARRRKKKQA